MARKHRVAPDHDGPTIMPRSVVERTRISHAEAREQARAGREWFSTRGIDPGDWNAVHPIPRAAQAAYGVPSALERARQRPSRSR
jgi:hypothetical protein